MPNMRIITTNLTDTAAVSASNQTSGFLIDNVKTDYKSTFHRSGGATPLIVTYTLSWNTDQIVGGISLPCTNLSAAATIRVQLFSDTAGTVAITTPSTGDTGATLIAACTGSPIASLTTSTPNGNLFQFGVLSKTSIWYPTNFTNVRCIKITLSDTAANTAGYIDCARIVCGSYWQPTHNASRNGLDLTVADTSQNSRTDAGDLVSDRGFINDELQLQLGLLSDTDRNNLLQLMRTAGTNRNILVSVFPENFSTTTRNNLTEQQYTVYGKRANSQFNYIIQGYGSSSMQITGW
jgi:hypothetical protein